jgi:hypothetical protein
MSRSRPKPVGRTYPKGLAGLSRKNPSVQDNLDRSELTSEGRWLVVGIVVWVATV